MNTTNMRDTVWIDRNNAAQFGKAIKGSGQFVLFTDDNTNQEKALIAQAMIEAFRNAYTQVLTGEVSA